MRKRPEWVFKVAHQRLLDFDVCLLNPKIEMLFVFVCKKTSIMTIFEILLALVVLCVMICLFEYYFFILSCVSVQAGYDTTHLPFNGFDQSQLPAL